MHVNLDGNDPVPNERCLLLVRTKDLVDLDPVSLAKKIVKWADFDLIKRNRSKALIAVTSKGGANDILRGMKQDNNFCVKKYSKFWNSWRCKWSLGGFILSAGIPRSNSFVEFLEV